MKNTLYMFVLKLITLLAGFSYIEAQAMYKSVTIDANRPSEKMLNHLMGGISNDWKPMARYLKISSEDIEELASNRTYFNTSVKARKMLQLWLQSDPNPTNANLIATLEKLKRMDLVDTYKQQLAQSAHPAQTFTQSRTSYSVKCLTQPEITNISDALSTGWFKLGLTLDLPFLKIENMFHEYNKNSERGAAVLSLWMESENATKQGLSQALNSIGRRDIAEQFDTQISTSPQIQAIPDIRQPRTNPAIHASSPQPRMRQTPSQAITEYGLVSLSFKIACYWKLFTATLGAEQSRIDAISFDHARYGAQEQAYQALVHLKRTGKLTNATTAGLNSMADSFQSPRSGSSQANTLPAHTRGQSQKFSLKAALLQLKLDGNDEKLECAVCLEMTPNILLGCSHAFCGNCLVKNADQPSGNLCPKCRRTIESVKPIFN